MTTAIRVAALAVTVWFPLAAGAEDGPPELLRLRVRRGEAPAATLSNVVGDGPAMVAFSAAYCAPCRAEVPVLRRAAARWRGHGVRVLAIAVDAEDAGDVAAVVREWGIDYEMYWLADDARAAAAPLAPSGLPVTFFIRHGSVSRVDRVLTDDDVDGLVPERLGLTSRPSG